MSKAAKSVFVFGVYLIIAGLGFLVMPNIPLVLLGFQATAEAWIRVTGCLMMAIGYYYLQASRNEIKQFLLWTVQVRPMIFVCFIVLVVLGMAQPMLIVFGMIDFLGAIWTWFAIRSE